MSLSNCFGRLCSLTTTGTNRRHIGVKGSFRAQIPYSKPNIFIEQPVMFECKTEDNGRTLILNIPSSMNQVGLILSAMKSFFKQHYLPENLINQNSIVLRELFVNAITHGHNFNQNLYVFIQIEYLKDNQFKLTVKDGGSGFDYSELELSYPENINDMRKRGMILVEALTEQYEFNEKGNGIVAYTLTSPLSVFENI